MSLNDWEQGECSEDIPVYSINFDIDHPFLVLHVRGDQHIGVRGIDINAMTEVYCREQEQHRGHMLVIDTGDIVENALKGSVGHNYDIAIPDPADQVKTALKFQDEVDAHLYGKTYKTMPAVTRVRTKHARRIGVIGNHEYRSRRTSGVWLNDTLFAGKGVLNGHIQCILKITLTNNKLKLHKEYRVWCAHRLNNSSAGVSHSTLLKNFEAKKGDIDADIYVCGHYHKRFLDSSIRYDINGKKKKILYVCNPSPVGQLEYAEWSMYRPIESAYYTNIYLPLDPNLNPWGKI